MLVPILDEVIGESGEAGIGQILIGMAHRGRLNVMAHVLSKPYEQILAEFKDPVSKNFREDMAWTGDVKYHAGAHRAIKGGAAMDLVVSMPPNPSHLEAIDPVVEGMARAAGTSVDGGGAPRFDPARSVPILIHGDAAFPGQGVVAETLNLSRLPGYRPAARFTSSPTTSSGSRPVPRTFTARRTRAVWRAGSRSRSSTSTPTIRKPASRRRGWRSRIARTSSATS